MFAQKLNELTFTLELIPQGPLLVKAGEEAQTRQATTTPPASVLAQTPAEQFVYFRDRKERERKQREQIKQEAHERRDQDHRAQQAARRAGQQLLTSAEPEPDMQFVRTRRRGRNEPYLPGSSLKGVLRSQAERLARSMTVDGAGACNPFGRRDSTDAPCSQVLVPAENAPRQSLPAWQIYPLLCAACKLFGAPPLAGRLRISDAYLLRPPSADPLPRRDGVGIDRRRGAAADGAKYDFEYWDGGAFQAQVQLQNFELWQVGWLAHLLHALALGELPIGFGTRRGLGRLTAAVHDLHISYWGRGALEQHDPGLSLLGLGALAAHQPALARYGFLPEASPQITAGVHPLSADSLALRRTWRLDEPDALWAITGPLWDSDLVTALQTQRLASLTELQASRSNH